MQKDFLSPKEIEALLQSDTEETLSGQSFQGKRVVKYDFRSPELLSKEKLRIFQLLMEEFAKKLTEFFTSQLKIPVDINISSIHQTVFREFQEREEKTRMAVFTMSPLEGSSLVEIRLPLIKFVNKALLGDFPENIPQTDKITPVEEETGVFLADKFLRSLKSSFGQLIDLDCKVTSMEKNPQMVFIASPEEPVIITTVKFTRGESFSDAYFCFPFIVFDSMLPFLDFKKWFCINQRKTDRETEALLKKNVEQIEVDVVCDLGSTELSLKQLLSLEQGDFLSLNNTCRDPLDLRVGSIKKFKVKPGLKGKKIALQVSTGFEK